MLLSSYLKDDDVELRERGVTTLMSHSDDDSGAYLTMAAKPWKFIFRSRLFASSECKLHGVGNSDSKR